MEYMNATAESHKLKCFVCDEADDLIEGAYVEEEGATLRLWLSKDYNGESFFAEEDGAEEGDQQGDKE